MGAGIGGAVVVETDVVGVAAAVVGVTSVDPESVAPVSPAGTAVVEAGLEGADV